MNPDDPGVDFSHGYDEPPGTPMRIVRDLAEAARRFADATERLYVRTREVLYMDDAWYEAVTAAGEVAGTLAGQVARHGWRDVHDVGREARQVDKLLARSWPEMVPGEGKLSLATPEEVDEWRAAFDELRRVRERVETVDLVHDGSPVLSQLLGAMEDAGWSVLSSGDGMVSPDGTEVTVGPPKRTADDAHEAVVVVRPVRSASTILLDLPPVQRTPSARRKRDPKLRAERRRQRVEAFRRERAKHRGRR